MAKHRVAKAGIALRQAFLLPKQRHSGKVRSPTFQIFGRPEMQTPTE
jgi:hypothetical protein